VYILLLPESDGKNDNGWRPGKTSVWYIRYLQTNFRVIKNKVSMVLPGIALTFAALMSPIVTATIPDHCEGKSYRPDIVPENMSVTEKKRRFRCLVQADIEAVFSELLAEYTLVQIVVKQGVDNEKLRRMRLKYGVETNRELLIAIKPHPPSITIAQAAIESAWGTSRIFAEANNTFGIRPFKPGEPRIAANNKRGDKVVWLRKYATIRESVADYFLVLGRSTAYKEFRALIMKTSDHHMLVTKLENYSERKAEYVRELSAMIRYNNFHELD
jgi:Bax protein